MDNNLLDANFALPIRSGDRLINVPRHSMSAQLVKETMLANRPLRLGAGMNFVGERLGEVATQFELPDYTLARIFADYSISNAVSVRADVDNLFDETYYTNSFSSLWIQPVTPRSYRVSVNMRF